MIVFEYGKMVRFGKKTVFPANFKDEEQMVGVIQKSSKCWDHSWKEKRGFTVVTVLRLG